MTGTNFADGRIQMFNHGGQLSVDCPSCGHRPRLDEILSRLDRDSLARFADGGAARERSPLEQQCGRCDARFEVPFKAVASLVIERQTQDLFSSITDVLRGKAKVQ